MRKIFISLVLAAATLSSSASFAAPVPVSPGGQTRAFNVTTNQIEVVPQCFPWVWLSQFSYFNSLGSALENQNVCRAQRSIDFPGY